MSGICATLLFLISLVCFLGYNTENANIQKYYATRQTIENARKSEISEIERAALTQKIIEVNSWLSEVKYWNETIFTDMIIPDKVMELEPLQ